MKILQVLTSHDQLGNTGRKTGFWLEEGAAPYFVFRDAGVDLTLASPKGGQPPIDPKSDLPENQTSAQVRFKKDESLIRCFIRADTVRCGIWRRTQCLSLFSNRSTIPASPLLWSAIHLACFAMLSTGVSRW